MSGTDLRGIVVANCMKGLSLAPVLLTAACVSFGPDVPDRLISLTPEVRAPAGELAAGAMENAIVVLDPDTDRRLDVARVPVQVNASTVAYLKDASWVERPARQFRQLLAETVRFSSGRVVVEGADYEVTGETVLSGRLLDMGYDARDQAVVVRYDALLRNQNGSVRSRRFEAIVPGIPAEVGAVAPALNEAANDVAQQVAEWITR